MEWQDDVEFNEERLIPIVVGVHPRAEMLDRPLAYRVLDRIEEWQSTYCDEALFQPVVLTDVWVLNHEEVLTRPAISIGNPRYNAASAFLTSKIPIVVAEEDRFLVQVESGPLNVRACLWGIDRDHTIRSVDCFLNDHVEDWLEGAADRCAPVI